MSNHEILVVSGSEGLRLFDLFKEGSGPRNMLTRLVPPSPGITSICGYGCSGPRKSPCCSTSSSGRCCRTKEKKEVNQDKDFLVIPISEMGTNFNLYLLRAKHFMKENSKEAFENSRV